MLTRRDLLKASSGAVALAGLPAGVRIALAATGSPLLVVVFLRGAADLLSLVAPSGNAEYQAARPTLAIPATGTGAGLPLTGALNGQSFRLHPAATGLAGLYDAGQLAIIHATGLLSTNRSHFQSQEMMERGYADAEAAPASGWLARHLSSSLVSGQVPIVAASAEAPMALLGEMRAVSMTTPASFRVSGASGTSVCWRGSPPDPAPARRSCATRWTPSPASPPRPPLPLPPAPIRSRTKTE